MGQMLRGGRSWPSERKLRAGEGTAGKAAPTAAIRGTAGPVLVSGVSEQDAEHRLHFSN